MTDWFTVDPSALVATVLSALAIYAILIVLVRVVGLRSFSKMTSVDFAMTIAMGSVLASTILTPSSPLVQGIVALASLFAIQWMVSWLRTHTTWMQALSDNEPIVLMAGTDILRDNLERTRVTETDLWAKIREANVLDPSEVRAVVLETTGDITVLHGEPGGRALHPSVLRGVRHAERVGLSPDDLPG
ncbi:DUF421 domain-containing protein [Rubrivirga sp. IMCC45206]|uniref:DUF421 domain-containing protein n=1 Tax=Rubrivirga sp. IMCC45206 TaxID=3391614 RepID=UPI00398FF644